MLILSESGRAFQILGAQILLKTTKIHFIHRVTALMIIKFIRKVKECALLIVLDIGFTIRLAESLIVSITEGYHFAFLNQLWSVWILRRYRWR